jgi:hypothetical protein
LSASAERSAAPAEATAPSSLLAGTAIGVGISMGCLLIPIVHFVSGPLGPAIGGFVGGSKCQARGGGVLAVGLGIGVGVAVVAAVIALIVTELAAGSSDMVAKLEDRTLLWSIVGGIAVYATGLGSFGAWLGGRASHEKVNAAPG